MKVLSDEIYKEVQTLSNEGNDFFEKRQFLRALQKYKAALSLVPEPKTKWEASTWLYTSIGDVNFSEENFSVAKENYYNALNCPNAIQNPYINLSLGQTLYEMEKFEQSGKFLMIAYMSEGKDIFEDEDPKYLESIADLISRP